MKRILLILPLALLSFSCAYHHGMMTGSAALTDADFRVVNIVSGTARTTHILGFGGLKPDALVMEAKKNMYLYAPLSKGQVYANISVDFKRSFFPFVGTTIATVSADVVEFGPPGDEADVFSHLKRNYSDNYIEANDSLGVYQYELLQMMKLSYKKNRHTYALTAADSTTQLVNVENIYQMESGIYKFDHGYDVGGLVEWKSGNDLKTGTIFGINEKSALIKTDDDMLQMRIIDLKPQNR